MDFQDYIDKSYQNGYQKGEESGYQIAVINNVKNLMENANMDLDQAMKMLGIPQEKMGMIRAAIEEQCKD